MSESNELYISVNYIKHKVEAIEKIEMLNLRSNSALKNEYIEILKADEVLYNVYKLIDGTRFQKEIALQIGKSDATVTLKIKELLDIGLIEIKQVLANNRKIYKHTIAEQAFKLLKVIG